VPSRCSKCLGISTNCQDVATGSVVAFAVSLSYPTEAASNEICRRLKGCFGGVVKHR
jgi:hypothetical protein